ncbi:MAG: hypothetical protein H6631_00730 [Anaerolineaceae bacterium]|nr:hypothetical protein [Anaerolineaceae bacterium]
MGASVNKGNTGQTVEQGRLKSPLKIAIRSVKVYFDPNVDDKASFVAPINFHCRCRLNRDCRTLLFVWAILLSACADTHAKAVFTPTPLPTPTRIPTLTPVVDPAAQGLPEPSGACPLTDLWPGLHISTSGSYTQTQTEAAGPPLCRIEPNSCAYHLLVGNLDADIVFKREEIPPFDEEDIQMHPAALLPLSRLNALVREEWDGLYQLRITDAYDSLLEHDLGQPDNTRRASLHFEGRALDLTTWPIKPELYGRLCMLAHCAGFDWVHNEGDHCHAAIKAESLCTQCGY